MTGSVGFIILRHVNSSKTNEYWKRSYKCIREWYGEVPILIIDDNSDVSFVDTEYESTLTNTKIIKSEYPGRGELLPYIYFLENHHCDVACIIHDSIFIQRHVDIFTTTYKKLWDFRHNWNNSEDEIKLLSVLENNEELLKLYSEKDKWRGCFGGMSCINYEFLQKINAKHNLYKLIPHLDCRHIRMRFERVIAILLQSNLSSMDDNNNIESHVLFGDIHRYIKWGITYEQYMAYSHIFGGLPFMKVWSGR